MSALGLESHHVFELPTDEELQQFINVDSSGDNNLNLVHLQWSGRKYEKFVNG